VPSLAAGWHSRQRAAQRRHTLGLAGDLGRLLRELAGDLGHLLGKLVGLRPLMLLLDALLGRQSGRQPRLKLQPSPVTVLESVRQAFLEVDEASLWDAD